MQTLLVASRKGIFIVRGHGMLWEITGHHFEGDPVTQVMVDPRNGDWYAALRMGHFGVKLRMSVDQGAHWVDIAAPAFPPKPTEGPLATDTIPWSVELIWSLTPGGPDQPGTLWAGCMPAGLFKSEDGGQSWALNTPLWEDPRNAQHISVAVSCGGVWQTQDGGATWALTAQGMTADYLPAEGADDQNTQDPHRMVQCAAQPDVLWVQHRCGIYRSTNGGKLWSGIAAPKPSGFGFAVAFDPQDPLRAWFVPALADTQRYASEGRMVVNPTDDGGASFETFGRGLPQVHAYHLDYRHSLDLAPDRHTLAMSSTTRGLWISPDAGEQWHCVSRDLPPVAALGWVVA